MNNATILSLLKIPSKEEVRHYAFSIYDPDGYGFITQDQFLDLLTVLHPKNQGPVTVG